METNEYGPFGGVWRSTDSGATWQGGVGLPDGNETSIVIGPYMFVGEFDAGSPPSGPPGVYCSADSGASWAPFSTGLTKKDVWRLALTDSFLFAGTADGGVFRSSNLYATWTSVNNGITNPNILVLSSYENIVFASPYGDGVYYSLDEGNSWTPMNDGLTREVVTALCVHDNYVFLGTDSAGVWRRPLTDFYPTIALSVSSLWNLISIPAQTSSSLLSAVLPAASTSAFMYSPGIGYRIQDTLITGYGFWVKFDSSQTQQFKALPIHTDTVNLVKGWNLVGSISDTISQNSITTLNYQLTLSNFYSYSGSYSIDTLIVPGKGYWVKANENGQIVLSSVPQGNRARTRVRIVPTKELPPPAPNASESKQTLLPKEYSLSQNYPNPFNPTTVINYALPRDGDVTVKIYNVLGQVVSTLVDEYEPAGYKSVRFDATNIPSGIYFCRFSSGNFTDVKKLVVMK